ncbi:MAG: ribonuclease E/G, partial [Pseudomonadota bacterium]
ADWPDPSRTPMREPIDITMRVFRELVVEPNSLDIMLDERLRDHPIGPWLHSDLIVFEPNPGDRFDVDRHQARLLTPQATFDGGRLLIQPTEALVAIDMDLADFHKWHTGLLEAARQIQLRNLSGSIVIDLPRGVDSNQVKQRMQGYLEQADIPATVHGLSRGGLLELSITRRWPMLHEVFATLPEQPDE